MVLLSQAFVHDPETTVAKALAAAEKEAGAPIKITGFYRFALGEGIDRTQERFRGGSGRGRGLLTSLKARYCVSRPARGRPHRRGGS